MSILTETAQIVQERLGEAFHHLTLEEVVLGIFFTGVKLSNGFGGLSYTPVKDIPEAVCCPSSAGRIMEPKRIRGMSVKEALSSLTSKEPLKVAVAIATLNALSHTCFHGNDAESYHIRRHMDALNAVRMPLEKSVAVIGAIVPALHILKENLSDVRCYDLYIQQITVDFKAVIACGNRQECGRYHLPLRFFEVANRDLKILYSSSVS